MEHRISASRADRLAEEQQAQKAWVLKRPALAQYIEGLLSREFLEPQAADDLEAQELQQILQFARTQVPYYRDSESWREFPLNRPVDREALAAFPVLNKAQLLENSDALKALQLPRGEKTVYEAKTTGTTGVPARVQFGRQASMVFGLLAQRPHRWLRFDPLLKQAVIRQARVMPKNSDGSLLKDGEVQRFDSWLNTGSYFHTGKHVAITRGNPLEFQLDWLRKERPAYLASSPGGIESMVYAAQGKPVDSLLGLRTVAATLTEAVRSQIELATGLPIQQPYGLNEIGVVANRCPAGRYHVNAEHCVVEVVNTDHQPCRPGEFGHVLVTGLTNFVMPLIRYDTGDLAEAVAGDCACGRTLPAFGRVLGRYRPLSHAPEGTTHRMDVIFGVLRTQPLELLAALREYQLHLYRNGRFELRLDTRGEPDPRLIAVVREAWDARAGDAILDIVRVDAIARIPGQKTQDFTSEFFPSIHEGS